MWFEIIPSFSICVVCLTIPHMINPWLNKLLLGNWYQRSLRFGRERHYVLRDERLNGSTYKPLGLKDLPDEPAAK
ncbi:NADH dehydrogenase [ubiquinone] 1 alpha subcomplex subunit 1 [Hyalella azteca]|uniref:NADH dehydrogenase [ubiquinone] 1 alpha subcomplex subunit 1 n=1 Tax=Hyalella azteca TaxID=294128 RepID=A0A8B7N0X8_HYAAZ|nr:NADH dehydrogenase [ubiquinone] 1 alpha subcomplex subunit 1 [Hyalella azteca]